MAEESAGRVRVYRISPSFAHRFHSGGRGSSFDPGAMPYSGSYHSVAVGLESLTLKK